MKQKTRSYSSLPMPAFLHELFGKRTTKAELFIVLLSCTVLSCIVLTRTFNEWSELAVWQKLLLILLTIDITGGVLANLTTATNKYYQESRKARLVFLAVHVQPLLIGWLFGDLMLCAAVWAGTIIAAWLISIINGQGVQRTAGMAVALTGICLLFAIADTSLIVKSLLALFIVKLTFSFAVDHDKRE